MPLISRNEYRNQYGRLGELGRWKFLAPYVDKRCSKNELKSKDYLLCHVHTNCGWKNNDASDYWLKSYPYDFVARVIDKYIHAVRSKTIPEYSQNDNGYAKEQINQYLESQFTSEAKGRTRYVIENFIDSTLNLVHEAIPPDPCYLFPVSKPCNSAEYKATVEEIEPPNQNDVASQGMELISGLKWILLGTAGLYLGSKILPSLLKAKDKIDDSDEEE